MSLEDIAIQIIDLTEEDFAAMEAECLNQANYHHPLKPATTAQMRKLGQHNLKSLKMRRKISFAYLIII